MLSKLMASSIELIGNCIYNLNFLVIKVGLTNIKFENHKFQVILKPTCIQFYINLVHDYMI
jgi:hypothetical protein